MPTTLDIFTPGAPAPGLRHLLLDACEQVVDVVALEHAFAQRFEHGPALRARRSAINERVPLRGKLFELGLVHRALLFDRPSRLLPSRLQISGRRARRAHAA